MISFAYAKKSQNLAIGNTSETEAFADFEFGLQLLFDGFEKVLAKKFN